VSYDGGATRDESYHLADSRHYAQLAPEPLDTARGGGVREILEVPGGTRSFGRIDCARAPG
jgi:hypothetical protein